MLRRNGRIPLATPATPATPAAPAALAALATLAARRDAVTLPTARRATRVSLPLIGAFAVGAIAYGGLYTFPAMSVAIAAEFGINRTLAVTPWTMFLVVSAVASPLLGRAYDELADRDLLTAAMVLLAGGWLAVYIAPDISIVILAYAVFLALGLQLSFVGTSTAIARRYEGMSGLALGITYAGPGLGVAIALPIAATLIDTAGWRVAALAFLASCLVGVVFVWLMTSGPAIVVPDRSRPMSKPPARSALADPPGAARGEPMSLRPKGTRAIEAAQAARSRGLHESSAPGAVSAAQEPLPVGSGEHRHSVRRTIRTRRFWMLFLGAGAIGAFDEGVLQAFVPGAVAAGFDAERAASALGLQSLAYLVGQVLGGWLSDRLGRRIVGIVAGAFAAGGVIAAIGLVGTVPEVAIAGLLLHGAGTGATIAVRSAAFGDVFGGAGFGTIFGLLAVAYPVGGTIAVYFGAIALDRTGSFAPLVPILLLAVAGWCVALWLAGPRRRPLRAAG